MSAHLNSFTMTTGVGRNKTLHTCREVRTPYGYSKVVNQNNDVAVIYCGGGRWGSICQNWDLRTQLMFDSRIIRHKFNGENSQLSYTTFMEEILQIQQKDHPYFAGFSFLDVKFVPEASLVRIVTHYDTEFVEILDTSEYTMV
jgi:hypothetical protein